ncbi:MAG: ZIP family metal transporter [Bacilli bacterium]|jgi:ZIP family zinc transporter
MDSLLENTWLIIIIGISFVFVMTSLGAALVFFFRKNISKNLNRIFLGFAAGVMIAASVWSLLIPAIESAEEQNIPGYIPAVIGFIAGGFFLLLIDKLLPHIHPRAGVQEGVKSSFQRTTMLVFAVTLHNIPEGLAVGLSFGLALKTGDATLLASALALSIGIGLQNFPEGAAISLPLKNENISNRKAFILGSLSGIVEPIAAVLGILLASWLPAVMPWFLAFAAGAMIYVVAEELIPEAQLDSHSNIGTIAVMVGFAVMMLLDVALG